MSISLPWVVRKSDFQRNSLKISLLIFFYSASMKNYIFASDIRFEIINLVNFEKNLEVWFYSDLENVNYIVAWIFQFFHRLSFKHRFYPSRNWLKQLNAQKWQANRLLKKNQEKVLDFWTWRETDSMMKLGLLSKVSITSTYSMAHTVWLIQYGPYCMG